MKLKNIVSIIFAATLFNSCVKDEFDTPPSGGQDPVVSGDKISIADLKALYAGSQVQADVYIVGTVIADDRSGNFYKELVLQDSTSGISILLDLSDYYTKYPIGRRVFVKCKGLYMDDYYGLIQLGGYIQTDGSLGRIPQSLISQYILPGSYYHYVTPQKVHINDLNSGMQNKLIMLDSLEFACSSAGVTFADAVNQEDVNLDLQDCSNNTVLIRSSGFANFATTITPGGNGSIVAVCQIYQTDVQLKIRELTDISMEKARCDGTANINIPHTFLDEDFESQNDNQDISICGWKNIYKQGNRKWLGKYYGGNTYAQATSFGATTPLIEEWLITPPLDLSVADTLTFLSESSFYIHPGLSVWISTDFDGGNINTATWTQLTATLAGSTPNVWIPSGSVPLTSFSGTGYILFKYTGNSTTQTSTFRVDDVMVH
ncbi:MAG: DUF5689 domain-containing protein [Bacteroidia bacterium]